MTCFQLLFCVQYNMEIKTFVEGEVVPSLPDGYHGIYVLLSGLLKVSVGSCAISAFKLLK